MKQLMLFGPERGTLRYLIVAVAIAACCAGVAVAIAAGEFHQPAVNRQEVHSLIPAAPIERPCVCHQRIEAIERRLAAVELLASEANRRALFPRLVPHQSSPAAGPAIVPATGHRLFDWLKRDRPAAQ